jgi:hypothetical protein
MLYTVDQILFIKQSTSQLVGAAICISHNHVMAATPGANTDFLGTFQSSTKGAS